jgi:tetratricopeptide (TPR) repeat protein
MPIYFDPIELEYIDTASPAVSFYIISVSDRYKVCATTQNLASQAMAHGDPETRAAKYWPLNRDQVNGAQADILFPGHDRILRSELFTLDELNHAFNFVPPFNADEALQINFGPMTPPLNANVPLLNHPPVVFFQPHRERRNITYISPPDYSPLALTRLNAKITARPNDMESRMERADWYEHHDNDELALTDLNHVIENINIFWGLQLEKIRAHAIANRGFLYEKQGDNTRALQEYTNALNINPDNAFATVRSKIVNQRLGNHEAALANEEALGAMYNRANSRY